MHLTMSFTKKKITLCVVKLFKAITDVSVILVRVLGLRDHVRLQDHLVSGCRQLSRFFFFVYGCDPVRAIRYFAGLIASW